MIINTSQPIVKDSLFITNKIATFWDKISEGWQLVWGDHIHHGFYENEEVISPSAAQTLLIDKLAHCIHLEPHAKILDVGCGMGATSIYLAKKFNAELTGINISQKQLLLAKKSARINNINIQFINDDALQLKNIHDQTYDVVWSLESAEQFFDKESFIKQAFRVLKPGGKLMLATWCSSHDSFTGEVADRYKKLCLAFDLPCMPSLSWYADALTKNKFKILKQEDWSDSVKNSWNVGLSLLKPFTLWQILKLGGMTGLRFSQQIKLMRDAFYHEEVKYGVFYCIK